MNIQVLGSGCPTCKKLYELTREAVRQLQLNETVEYSTDVSKIIDMGVMTSPVLAVDGKPVMTGCVPDVGKIKSLLLKQGVGSTMKKTEKCEHCNCGGNC